jgi:hydrogenase-4 component F
MVILLLALLIVPPVTGLLCRLLRREEAVEAVNVTGATLLLLAGLALALQVFRDGPVGAFGTVLYVDALGALLIGVIVAVGWGAALYSVGYLRHDIAHGEVPRDQLGWYYLGFHGFLWTMLLTGMVNNLGLLWVAIEATTIVSALLVGFYRTPAALEAAWKYLILCTVGIAFALFGVLLTYYAALQGLDTGASLDWTTLVAGAGRLDPGVMKLAFVFVVIGFGTKAGFAPLHTWLPDAHSQAPSPISAALSGVLLNCAVYGIFRFHLIVSGTALGPGFSSHLLIGFGLLSVAVAVPFLLVQTDIKRLLAYSSVEHIGLIAVAIGFGGPIGIYAGLLHLVNHALTKALLFFVAGELVQRYGTRHIRAIRGVVTGAPILGSLLLIGAFAITGLPPFGIFVSELGIVGAGFRAGYWPLVAVLVVLLALVFGGIFNHVARMAFGPPGARRPKREAADLGRRSVALLSLQVLAITILGLYVPPPLTNALQQIVGLFAGGKP